ncbi:MAG: hypothetical protein HFJ38_05760 [Bacilli bacterium]|nr:hypothetical protein [Bacilli bacterium]
MSENQKLCKIELLEDDKMKLDMFLLMTTKYRQEEMETWKELSKERNQDGTPVYKNAESNAKWWGDLCSAIPRISDAIKKYEYVIEKTNSMETEEKNEPDICE